MSMNPIVLFLLGKISIPRAWVLGLSFGLSFKSKVAVLSTFCSSISSSYDYILTFLLLLFRFLNIMDNRFLFDVKNQNL